MTTKDGSTKNYGALRGGDELQASQALLPQRGRSDADLEKTRRWSFAAGIFYSIIILCGIFAEVGLRGTVVDFNDPAATAENIKNNPGKLRWALMLDLLMSCSDVVVSVLLGGILLVSGADPILSFIMVGFRLMQQAVLSVNLLHMFASSLLLADSLPVASVVADSYWGEDKASSSESLAFLFLLMYEYGYLLAFVFFGISLLVLGYVILIWGIFPKWIGCLLFLAGVGYVTDSTLFFVMAGYNGRATAILMLPAFVAEFGFTGCLLLKKQDFTNQEA